MSISNGEWVPVLCFFVAGTQLNELVLKQERHNITQSYRRFLTITEACDPFSLHQRVALCVADVNQYGWSVTDCGNWFSRGYKTFN